MKTLHLTISKQWFDMIVAGIKRKEYREIKRYWSRRLFDKPSIDAVFAMVLGHMPKATKPIGFDRVHLTNGPYSYTPGKTKGKVLPYAILEFKGLTIGNPNPEWVPDGVTDPHFAIEFGELIETNVEL